MQRDTDNVELCGEVAKGWAQSPLGYRVLLKQFSWKCLEGRVIQQGGISEFSRTTLQQITVSNLLKLCSLDTGSFSNATLFSSAMCGV
jgi:hypothetical protein